MGMPVGLPVRMSTGMLVGMPVGMLADMPVKRLVGIHVGLNRRKLATKICWGVPTPHVVGVLGDPRGINIPCFFFPKSTQCGKASNQTGG